MRREKRSVAITRKKAENSKVVENKTIPENENMFVLKSIHGYNECSRFQPLEANRFLPASPVNGTDSVESIETGEIRRPQLLRRRRLSPHRRVAACSAAAFAA